MKTSERDELRKGSHIATVAKLEPWENTERRRQRLLQDEEICEICKICEICNLLAVF